MRKIRQMLGTSPEAKTSRKNERIIRKSSKAVKLGSAAVERAASLQARATRSLEELDNVLKNNKLPLTAEELKEFAQVYPQWNVTTGFSNGVAKKQFTRNISDFHPTVLGDRETNLRFGDAEHFDLELQEIFDTWSGDGDLGSFPHFTLKSEENGPLTQGDMWKIDLAEVYLRESGMFKPMVDVASPTSRTQAG